MAGHQSYAASLFADLQEALVIHNRDGKKPLRGPFVVTIGNGERFVLDRLDTHPVVRPVQEEEDETIRTAPEIIYRDEATFQAIFERKLRPDKAWARGSLTIKGNLNALAELRELFSVLRAYKLAKKRRQEEERAEVRPSRVAEAQVPSSSNVTATSALVTPVRLTAASSASDGYSNGLFSPQTPGTPAATASAAEAPKPIDRELWQPDLDDCALCGTAFSLFNRPHHCRYCGKCVCDADSRLRYEGLRICDPCAKAAVTSMASPAAPPSNQQPQQQAPQLQLLPAIPESPAGLATPFHATSTPQPQLPRTPFPMATLQQQSTPASASGSLRRLPPSSGKSAAISAAAAAEREEAAMATTMAMTKELSAVRKSLQAVEGEVKALREHSVAAEVAKLQGYWYLPFRATGMLLAAAAVIDVAWFILVTRFIPFIAANAGKKAATSAKAAAKASNMIHHYGFSVLDAGSDAVTWRNRYIAGALLLVLVTLLWALRPSGLLGRRLKAFFTAAVVLLRLRSLRNRTATMSDEEGQPLWDTEHAVLSRFAYENMLGLKAFWLKLGQYVASRADVFPPSYVKELSKLQDATEPMPFAVVKAVIESDLRGKTNSGAAVTLDSLFSFFDEKPIASASIAQVHRATLRTPVNVKVLVAKDKDGKVSSASTTGSGSSNSTTQLSYESRAVSYVVVKVQHEGVDRLMLSDLTTLDVIVRVVAWLESEYDFRPVVNEWSREAVKELDFTREAAITAHAGKVLAAAEVNARTATVVDLRAVLGSQASQKSGSASTNGLTLPDGYHYATKRVMLLEFVNGIKATDVDALDREGVDKARLANDVVEAYASMMLVEGTFSGDPHAGNLLCEIIPSNSSGARARPVILDFGLSKILSDPLRLAFCKMICAAKDGDAGAILDSFDEMGVVLNREDPAQDLETMQFLLRDAAPAAEARQKMMARRKVWQERFKKRREMKLKKPVASFPPALIFLIRTSEMLHGLGAKLGAHVPFGTILERYARAALRTHGAAHVSSSALAASMGSSRSNGTSTNGSSSSSLVPAHRRAVDPAFSILHSPPQGSLDIGMLTEKRILHVRECCKRILVPSSGSTASTALPGPAAMTAMLASSLPIREAIALPSSYRCRLEQKVYGLLKELWTAGEISGCQVAVYRHGTLVVDAAYGELGPLDPRPMRSDTLVNCFSVTKGIVATLFHVMMHAASQNGALAKLQAKHRQKGTTAASSEASDVSLAAEYELPVTELWPTFAPAASLSAASAAPLSRRQQALAASKASTTVAHILTHTSGLQHAIPADITMSRFAQVEAMVKAMEEAVPTHKPGSHTSYHYYTYGWLMAGLINGMASALGLQQQQQEQGGSALASVGKLLHQQVLKKISSGGTGNGGAGNIEREMFIGVPDELLPPVAASAATAASLPSSRFATLSGSLFAASEGAGRKTKKAEGDDGTPRSEEDASVEGDEEAEDADETGITAEDGGAGKADESSAAASFSRLQRMLEMAERFAAEPDRDDDDGNDEEDGESTGGSRNGTIATLFSGANSSPGVGMAGSSGMSKARLYDLKALSRLIVSIKERLHILDPRLYNRPLFRKAEIPAANGHFTARALARFYACLGQPLYLAGLRQRGVNGLPADFVRLPSLLPLNRLRYVTSLQSEEQQATNVFVQGGWRTRFGLGYQIYLPADAEGSATPSSSLASRFQSPQTPVRTGMTGRSPAMEAEASALLPVSPAPAPLPMLPSDASVEGGNGSARRVTFKLPADEDGASTSGNAEERAASMAFGHSGFGGSLALYDPSCDLGVAITVNRLSNHKGATAALLRLIAESEGGVRFATF